jgi:sugar/nucleoside kinase (ribokinase family)
VIGLDERATRDDLVKLGRRLVAEKVMACHITVGGGGSLLFYHERGSVCCEQCPPFKVSPIVDVIGCGDAFGAAFLVHFMRTRNFSTATDFANQVAGLNCAFMGSLTPEIFQKIVHPQLEEIA